MRPYDLRLHRARAEVGSDGMATISSGTDRARCPPAVTREWCGSSRDNSRSTVLRLMWSFSAFAVFDTSCAPPLRVGATRGSIEYCAGESAQHSTRVRCSVSRRRRQLRGLALRDICKTHPKECGPALSTTYLGTAARRWVCRPGRRRQRRKSIALGAAPRGAPRWCRSRPAR